MATHSHASEEYFEVEYRVLVKQDGAIMGEEWFMTHQEATDFAREHIKTWSSATAHVELVIHQYSELGMFVAESTTPPFQRLEPRPVTQQMRDEVF